MLKFMETLFVKLLSRTPEFLTLLQQHELTLHPVGKMETFMEIVITSEFLSMF